MDDHLWEELYSGLQHTAVEIKFKLESSGFQSNLICTLAPKLLPEKAKQDLNECTGSAPYGFLKVWSLNHNDWRSVRKGTIESLHVYDMGGARSLQEYNHRR